MSDNTKAEIKKKSGISPAEIYMKYGMLIILVVFVIVSALLSKNFLKIANLTNILRQTSVVAIIAFGQTFILILGMIDLSQGSVMALAGCIGASIVTVDNTSVGLVLLGFVAGTLIGLVCGTINGVIITTFRIPAFIMTLAMMNIARGVVLLYTNADPVAGLGDIFKVVGQGNILTYIPVPVLFMLALMVVSWLLLNKTKFGRHVFATGGNTQAARASGVKTNAVINKSFILCGALTGLAGVLLTSRMNSGQPAGAQSYEFQAITAAVVGGTSLMGGIGSIFGTFVGCLIIGVLNNIMNICNVSSYWQQIVSGVVIVLAVIADVKTKSIIMGKKA